MPDLTLPAELPSTAEQWAMTVDATAEARAFILRQLLPGWTVARIGRTGYARCTPPGSTEAALVNVLAASAIEGGEWRIYGTLDALAVALAVAWEVER